MGCQLTQSMFIASFYSPAPFSFLNGLAHDFDTITTTIDNDIADCEKRPHKTTTTNEMRSSIVHICYPNTTVSI